MDLHTKYVSQNHVRKEDLGKCWIYLVNGYIRTQETVLHIFIPQLVIDLLLIHLYLVGFIPSKNKVLATGCNERGDLGVGHDDPIDSLQELEWTHNIGIIDIVPCSYKAFCFIAFTGEIYVSGCNDFGQL
eukprot:120191_1